MFIKNMSNYDFIKLCEARQRVGHKKYGEADIDRDVCKDIVEEIADVLNILNRRMWHLVKREYDEDILDQYSTFKDVMSRQCLDMFYNAKKLDDFIKGLKYKENDVKRIWFDEELERE